MEMNMSQCKEWVTALLGEAVNQQVSDVFLIAGFPVAYKKAGAIQPRNGEKLRPEDTRQLIEAVYEIAGGRSMTGYDQAGDDDFSFSIPDLGRFRVSAYRQRGSCAAVIRSVAFRLPDPSELHIPDTVMDFHKIGKGLVLVTGPAGSGKSTTLSCIIDKMNRTYPYHIITIEDPIEFLFRNDHSIVSQREVSHDTESFESALRYALRQSPNVIMLGEMRDLETISTAMTAAETGQLILSTLHTIGAGKTIDRIVDVFPANRQQQVRVQLSMVLQAVVTQQLLPTVDGHIVPAFEIMLATPAIRTMIREQKVHQINSVIHSGSALGMTTMDNSIITLYNQGVITRETALMYATEPETMKQRLQ